MTHLIHRNLAFVLVIALMELSGCASDYDKLKAAERQQYLKDYDKAEEILLDVARDDKNSPGFFARRDLAKLYDEKSGMKPDAKKALYWRIKAAEHPSNRTDNWAAEREHSIAEAFRQGQGTSKDPDAACKWDEKAYRSYLEDKYISDYKRKYTMPGILNLLSDCSISDPVVKRALAEANENRQADNQRTRQDAERARQEAERNRLEEESRRIERSRD